MGLLRQLGNALFLRRGFIWDRFFIRREVLIHFALMFVKLEFIYPSCADLESLDVACLISHDLSFDLNLGCLARATGHGFLLGASPVLGASSL